MPHSQPAKPLHKPTGANAPAHYNYWGLFVNHRCEKSGRQPRALTRAGCPQLGPPSVAEASAEVRLQSGKTEART